MDLNSFPYNRLLITERACPLHWFYPNPDNPFDRMEFPSSPTIWVPEGYIVKLCNVSTRYLAKARTLYKRSVMSSIIPGLQDTFLLEKSHKAWRWAFKGGTIYYDIDTIPNRAPTFYRSCLPEKYEVVTELECRINEVWRDFIAHELILRRKKL